MPTLTHRLSGLVLAAIGALSAWGAAQAQPATAAGQQVWNSRCKGCHEPPVGRAPGQDQLAQRPPEDIVRALTTGIMVPMAQGLSPEEIKAVAGYLTQVKAPASAVRAGAGEVRELPPQVAIKTGPVGTDPRCASNPPIRATAGDWASTGLDAAATRFQRRPGLSPADVRRLKVKWSFSMTGGGQPTVVGDWLFVTNRSGKFYALDAKTGCVRWVVSEVVARTTPIIAKSSVSPSGWVAYVGESARVVSAFDAQTGSRLWQSAMLDPHPIGVLTGSPVLEGDRLIVPISSIEEAAAMSKGYACCSFRGSVAALDARTGKLLWKTSMIPEPMKVVREKDNGLKVSGPAGAAIWAAPSIDRKRGLAYVVTGDSYTDIDTVGADAIVALDLKTGAIRWRRQVTEKDNFVMGCGPSSTSGNCPTPMGPDYDFGATPILMTVKGGKQVLVAGQKSGVVYGLDPDTGALSWKTQVGAGSALGGVEWGIGANDTHVIAPISDLGRLFRPGSTEGKPGVYALDPATGAIAWSAPAPVAACAYAADKGKPSRCVRAQPAAPAVMPGLVFEGGLDGWFRAYDAKTGAVAWEHSTTAQTYDTVNGIKGQPGGGIDGMGPTIANGMVYILSGNNGAARIGSNGVNVLLAYSVDGK